MVNSAIEWITGRDTGMSSKAVWSHMMAGRSDGSYPHDADDFGRIARLLDVVPEWKPRLSEMARYGAEWVALVEAWDDLDALYRQWWGSRGPNARKQRRTWDAFMARYDAAMARHVRCGDCDKPLRGSWIKLEGKRRCFPCDKATRGAA